MAVMLLPALITGCITTRIRQPSLTPLHNAESYLRTILRESADSSQLTGFSHFKIQSPQGRFSLKGAVFLQVPASMRIETLSLFNQSAFLVATDGKILSVLYPSQNLFYTGTVNTDGLAVLFGTGIAPSEAVCILLGYPPVTVYDPAAIIVWQQASHYVMLLSAQGKAFQQLWIDPLQNKIIKYVRLLDNKTPAWECSFSEFKSILGKPFPYKRALTFYPAKTCITITYETVDLNAPVSPERFILKSPPGATVLPLGALSKNHQL